MGNRTHRILAKQPARDLAVVAVLGILSGCVAPLADDQTDAMIARDVHFRVPAPETLGYSVSAAQLVTAQYGDKSFVFQAQLVVTPDKLTMVGLDSLGRRALTITSTAGKVEVDAAPWLPKDIRTANILADIALVYWPDRAVQDGLASSHAVVRTNARDRSITVNGGEIIHIDYDADPRRSWPASAHYRNLAFKYNLDLQSSVTTQ